ncbi:MAG: KAP family NTPase [Magnetococcus sp. DMHC-8]
MTADLRRPPEMVVSADNPWGTNEMGRKEIGLRLTNWLRSTGNNPFVFSINGAFGSGKSTFVNMWRADLQRKKYDRAGQLSPVDEADKNTTRHLTVYFNAWENDHAEDPLLAIISEIKSRMDEFYSDYRPYQDQMDQLQEQAWKIGRQVVPAIVRTVMRSVLGNEWSGMKFDKEDIADWSKVAGEMAKEYLEKKKAMEKFKTQLQNFARDITASGSKQTALPAGHAPTPASFDAPIVIFIDELDRCRPDFAVRTLERIKHLFAVEGVVFVLSQNREQLAAAVKSMYGQEMDAEGYLRRFIDLEFNMPAPSLEKYCNHLWEHFGMQQLTDANPSRALLKIFTRMADSFQFDLRRTGQCFTELRIILSQRPDEVTHVLIGFLLALKWGRPALYRNLVAGNLDVLELVNKLCADIGSLHPFFQTHIGTNMLACLIYSQTNIPDWSVINVNLNLAKYDTDYAGSIKAACQAVAHLVDRGQLQTTAKMLEFSERFS